ncbi:DinB family protein [Aquimarina sp. RZ0]|uniref:DinB family protein n=1 Tax=Aquimarina sp. RZ0 TaxID=2607730 RepID=UPI0011F0E103|nr:DinB family protein [Aquimarina sp. RZ0]KAA1245194.1 damage-inducible protein DinB [Aquimarina sp. RZ0]
MMLTNTILEEFIEEMDTTIRIFEALTDEMFDFSPHKKSKTVEELANHMVLIPSWVVAILGSPILDWAQYTPPAPITNVKDLINTYKENIASAIKSFNYIVDKDLTIEWTMKNGDFTFFTVPKYVAIKKLIINHTIHHRAQMGVNLRLNDIDLPASYVSSADENLFS